jgi:hypothetical protein
VFAQAVGIGEPRARIIDGMDDGFLVKITS